jgi:hypothetical protein
MLLFLVGSAGLAQAGIIEYATQSVGPGRYQYEYTVFNDHITSGIEEFTVYFELGLYEALQVEHTPPGWDPLVIQPDPGLPDDGYYDALADSSGTVIPLGGATGGFVVSFDWLGSGLPGAQEFEIVHPETFETLFSGTTTPVVTAIAEPTTLWLLAVGVVALVVHRRQQRSASERTSGYRRF